MKGATFSRSKIKYSEYWFKFGCRSKSNKNLMFRFYSFPRANEHVYVKNIFENLEKRDKIKAWIHALKIQNIIRKIRVCLLYFKREDYIICS